MQKYSSPEYTLEQIVEIYRGLREGVKVSLYDCVENSADRMFIIRECLYAGVPEFMLNQTLSNECLECLLDAHREGLDVTYLKDACSDLKVLKTRVSELKDHLYWSKVLSMEEKHINILVSCFGRGFNLSQVKIIAKCLNYGIDYTPLLNTKFTVDQMNQLLLMLQEGVDVEPVAKPEVSWFDMALHRLRS